jgi:dihydroorotate dehydrogenase (NAD+) catalytic subunit
MQPEAQNGGSASPAERGETPTSEGQPRPQALPLASGELPYGSVLNGSGTFDPIAAHRTFGDTMLESFPFEAFVSKTITLAPRTGNAPPRLWETPAGLINSIGLPNKGLHAFLDDDFPFLAGLPVPLVVSVMGFDHDQLAELVRAVGEREETEAIELNFSCPNVDTGLIMGADPGEIAAALRVLRPLTEKPLIAKLTPTAPDQAAVAAAAAEAGADALSLINTLPGMALDPVSGRQWLGAGRGGQSGPAVRAVALNQVNEVARATGLPVIGMGGVTCGRDAADFLRAGATCVAVGTETFRDPAAGVRVRTELVGVREAMGPDRRAAATSSGDASAGDH